MKWMEWESVLGESFMTCTLMQEDAGWQCDAFSVWAALRWCAAVAVLPLQHDDEQDEAVMSGDTAPVWAQCSMATPALVQMMTSERASMVRRPVIRFIGAKIVLMSELAKNIPFFSIFRSAS